MASNATLVLVPGSFSYSHFYDPLVEPLRKKGYDIHVLDPPAYPANYEASKASGKAPTLADDAAFVADFVRPLVEQGKEVVVCGHSYGGSPTSECLKGLTKREREKEGKQGGVVRAAYITAVVPKVGENLIQTNVGGGEMSIEAGEDMWMTHADPVKTGATVYSGLDPEEQVRLSKLFGHHSAPSFMSPLTYEGYKDVPVSWFFCAEDLCVVPAVQQGSIDRIEASWTAGGGRFEGQEKNAKVDVTSVKCDHVPIFSALKELQEWVEGIILKAGQE